MGDIDNLRQNIDDIDEELLSLFIKRMDIVKKIGEYKYKNNLIISDVKREKELMKRIILLSPENLKKEISTLFSTIIEISKSYQKELQKCNIDSKDNL